MRLPSILPDSDLACSGGGQRENFCVRVRAPGFHTDRLTSFVHDFDFSVSLLVLDIDIAHVSALVDALCECLD